MARGPSPEAYRCPRFEGCTVYTCPLRIGVEPCSDWRFKSNRWPSRSEYAAGHRPKRIEPKHRETELILTQTHTNDFASSDTLGGRISFARELTKLTMAQVATRLGVETACWKAWECDRAAPQSNRLATMAGILGVSPSWLLSGMGAGPLALESNDDAALLRELQIASADAVTQQRRVQEIVALLGSVRAKGKGAGGVIFV